MYSLSGRHLAIPIQTAPQHYAFVQTATKNTMSSSEAVPSTNLNTEVAAFRFKRDPTLKEARQEACLGGFQQVPLSQRISINIPRTTSITIFPSTTSYPPSTHTSSSPTPLVPSSSTITSSTTITLSSSTYLASSPITSITTPVIPS